MLAFAVTGRVVDGKTLQPIHGAQVRLQAPSLAKRNRSWSTVAREPADPVETAQDGSFEMQASPSEVLRITHAEYVGREIPLPGQLQGQPRLELGSIHLRRSPVIHCLVREPGGAPIEGALLFSRQVDARAVREGMTTSYALDLDAHPHAVTDGGGRAALAIGAGDPVQIFACAANHVPAIAFAQSGVEARIVMQPGPPCNVIVDTDVSLRQAAVVVRLREKLLVLRRNTSGRQTAPLWFGSIWSANPGEQQPLLTVHAEADDGSYSAMQPLKQVEYLTRVRLEPVVGIADLQWDAGGAHGLGCVGLLRVESEKLLLVAHETAPMAAGRACLRPTQPGNYKGICYSPRRGLLASAIVAIGRRGHVPVRLEPSSGLRTGTVRVIVERRQQRVQGAQVRLTVDMDPSVWPTTPIAADDERSFSFEFAERTDAAGTASLAMVPLGRGTLDVRAPGCALLRQAVQVNERTAIVIVVQEGVTVRGSISGLGKGGPSDHSALSVQLSQSGSVHRTIPDPTGSFVLGPVAAGDYELSGWLRTDGLDSRWFYLGSGIPPDELCVGRKPLALLATESERVVGLELSRPQPQVLVAVAAAARSGMNLNVARLRRSDSSAASHGRAAQTWRLPVPADGRLALHGLENGTYSLVLSEAGSCRGWSLVEVAAQPRSIELTVKTADVHLSEAGRLRLVAAAGSERLDVAFEGRQGSAGSTFQAIPDGHYVLQRWSEESWVDVRAVVIRAGIPH